MSTGQLGDHLVVFVHGLWGNPSHLEHMSSTLRSKYDESKLLIHVACKNAGNFTYDGIERGAERVLREIESIMEGYKKQEVEIKKFSLVGYSLGGLISRYVAGLMYSKGMFKDMEPVNFTTFATPHLGIRTPLVGLHNHIWNVVGARTLSASGRQMFMIDNFRDTGRPLLEVMADKDLDFWKGLSLFKHKSIYANVINDRAVSFYTASITPIDPFEKLKEIEIFYLKGYGDIILDPSNPPKPISEADLEATGKRLTKKTKEVAAGVPYYLLFAVLIPVGLVVFAINAGIQTFTSRRRMRVHDQKHKHPTMVEGLQERMDSVIEGLHHAQSAHHIRDEDYGPHSSDQTSTETLQDSNSQSLTKGSTENNSSTNVPNKYSEYFPMLALAPKQFQMIANLDELGFTKINVHIHRVRHSHAAIIYRRKSESFSEGKVVIRHWVDELFSLD